MPLIDSTTINRYKAANWEDTPIREWVEVVGPGRRAAFALITSLGGGMLETVDFVNGRPDWEQAGEVEVNRASNPRLCGYINELLTEVIV